MSAGSRYVYNWKTSDGKLVNVPAPNYIRTMFTWIEQQFADHTLFPLPSQSPSRRRDGDGDGDGATSRKFVTSSQGHSHGDGDGGGDGVDMCVPMDQFPCEFRTVVSTILRRLFRVYAHLYCSHSRRIGSIGLHDVLHHRFYHLVYFMLEFNLIQHHEMRPLKSLIQQTFPQAVQNLIRWS